MLVSSFQKRLKEALEYRKTSSAEIVRRSESLFNEGKIDKPLNQPSMTKYLQGEYKAKSNNIAILSLLLNVDEAWLMGYDVPMARSPKDPAPVVNNAFFATDKPIQFPILGKISAGLPILAVENIEGYEFAPSSFIKQDFEYFYLRVTGDSMNLKFPEGEYVLVQKQDFLDNGDIGVILVNRADATVKRFKEDGGLIILEPMSNNPEHHVQVYNPKTTEIKIIGKVVLHLGKV